MAGIPQETRVKYFKLRYNMTSFPFVNTEV